MRDENRVGNWLPDKQFVATRQEILDLLNTWTGRSYSEETSKQIIDATVIEIGWIWWGTMDDSTKARLLKSSQRSDPPTQTIKDKKG